MYKWCIKLNVSVTVLTFGIKAKDFGNLGRLYGALLAGTAHAQWVWLLCGERDWGDMRLCRENEMPVCFWLPGFWAACKQSQPLSPPQRPLKSSLRTGWEMGRGEKKARGTWEETKRGGRGIPVFPRALPIFHFSGLSPFPAIFAFPPSIEGASAEEREANSIPRVYSVLKMAAPPAMSFFPSSQNLNGSKIFISQWNIRRNFNFLCHKGCQGWRVIWAVVQQD